MRTISKVLIGLLVVVLLIAGGVYFFSDNSGEKISVDSIYIKASIKEGFNLEKTIKITNIDADKNFKFSISGLDAVLENNLIIEKGETKSLFINFSSHLPGVYTGVLLISSEDCIKRIPITLEVETRDVLFDGDLNVYPAGEIYTGEDISAELKIFDLAGVGNSKVEINYLLLGYNGDVLENSSESLSVNSKATLAKSVSIPDDAKEGEYVFASVIRYKNSVGTTSYFLTIAKKKNFVLAFFDKINFFPLFFGTCFIIVVLILFLEYSRKTLTKDFDYKLKEVGKIKKQIKSKVTSQKAEEYQNKLKEQLAALEKAKSEGFVSKEAYEKDKRRVEKLIAEVKKKSL